MPETTLKALADHGDIGETLPVDAHVSDQVLARFTEAGIDIDALGAQLLDEGAKSFGKSWKDLMECIASKSKSQGRLSSEGAMRPSSYTFGSVLLDLASGPARRTNRIESPSELRTEVEAADFLVSRRAGQRSEATY